MYKATFNLAINTIKQNFPSGNVLDDTFPGEFKISTLDGSGAQCAWNKDHHTSSC